MDNSFYLLMDLLITACGGYVIFQYVRMAASRTIRQNALFPKDLDVKKCSDTEAYIKYIGPRQIGFGIMAVVCGLIGVYQDYTGSTNMVLSMGSIVVFLVFCFWYGYAVKQAGKKYWGR